MNSFIEERLAIILNNVSTAFLTGSAAYYGDTEETETFIPYNDLDICILKTDQALDSVRRVLIAPPFNFNRETTTFHPISKVDVRRNELEDTMEEYSESITISFDMNTIPISFIRLKDIDWLCWYRATAIMKTLPINTLNKVVRCSVFETLRGAIKMSLSSLNPPKIKEMVNVLAAYSDNANKLNYPLPKVTMYPDIETPTQYEELI